MKRLFILFLCLSLLSSCFRDIHRSIIKGVYPDQNKFEIKSMVAGCCGCETIYYNLYAGNRVDEQFVDEYSCGFGEPTKYKFNYNNSGQRSGITSLIAVYDSTFATPVTVKEKLLFASMDSILINTNSKDKRLYSSITGFRLPTNSEKIHPFAFDKKGNAIHPR